MKLYYIVLKIHFFSKCSCKEQKIKKRKDGKARKVYQK